MKGYLFSLCMLVALSATAQEFKPFKVNVSLGFAKPLGVGASGGVLFAIEPKYGLSDNFDLGLRLETALVARSIVSNGNSVTGDIGAFGSYLITGNYLFGTGNTRPFLGAGLGVYRVASGGTVTVVDGQSPQQVSLVAETKFGGMIRAGLKTGHFVIGVEYNAVPTTSNKLSSTTIDSKNAYLGIKLGFDIGGGRL
ncbi:outer membrane beta-barrel protein [Spirosoma sp. KCTC 42546]|uniref:outer membrane beta-barrel protein n=1 Tax=Spirosoma sp. KCTC 42546 TaxID=2520506 RepID=UPI00115B432C|nr:outer membrane beta-barrel protein [Spirosoma sp. KCTC 42546]QDK79539.1 outer membrane beta-barrel protein [Spirosoma sp. KCTC 42546]